MVGSRGTELVCQCRRYKRRGLEPWVGKIPWRRKWEPTPVLQGKFHGWKEEPDKLQSMELQRVR